MPTKIQTNIHWDPGQRQALRGSRTASSTLLHPKESETETEVRNQSINLSVYKGNKYIFYCIALNLHNVYNITDSSWTIPITRLLVKLRKFQFFKVNFLAPAAPFDRQRRRVYLVMYYLADVCVPCCMRWHQTAHWFDLAGWYCLR